MNIGVLKEIKKDENRVALQPCQIKELINYGHHVFIENNAGLNSGYKDQEYLQNGAVVATKQEILQKCRLILKIKAPLQEEYNDYNENHILFTYLHFDENISPENINKLIKSKFLGIAYEWVELDGRYPLLEPMSRLTGYLFVQKSSEFLARYKGILCGKYEGYLQGANILIIGAGNIGLSAIKYSIDNNYNVTIVDKTPKTLNDRLNKRFNTNIDYIKNYNLSLIKFNPDNPYKTRNEIAKILPQIDILMNCAVRRPDMPKEKLDYLVNLDMIKSMQENSVVCDTTACDKDLIETAISTESLYDFERIEGIIHYNCDHLPSYVGKTASDLLTNATFPYILQIAQEDTNAIKNNPALAKGTQCYKGKLTHKYSAQKKKISYTDIMELL